MRVTAKNVIRFAVPLPRVFRARDHRLAAGKAVAWVRARYEGARPLANLRRSP